MTERKLIVRFLQYIVVSSIGPNGRRLKINQSNTQMSYEIFLENPTRALRNFCIKNYFAKEARWTPL